MKCPQCETVMKKGYIPVYKNQLRWVPEDETMPRTVFDESDGEVVLSNPVIFMRQKRRAYYCPCCEFVIIRVLKAED